MIQFVDVAPPRKEQRPQRTEVEDRSRTDAVHDGPEDHVADGDGPAERHEPERENAGPHGQFESALQDGHESCGGGEVRGSENEPRDECEGDVG